MPPPPSVQVLGAYRVEPTPELFAAATELKYADLVLEGEERREAEDVVRDEISNVVLLEALVCDWDARFDVGDFGQEGSETLPEQ